MTDVFSLTPPAQDACRRALDGLTADDQGRPTPCADFTVGQVVEHLHTAMVRLAALAGTTLDGSAPLDDLVAGAVGAWRARGLDGDVDLRGPLAARRAAEIIPLELVVHGWDIATATGRPFAIDDGTVLALLAAAAEIVPSRRGKAFGPERPAPDGATPLERLLAFTGRAV